MLQGFASAALFCLFENSRIKCVVINRWLSAIVHSSVDFLLLFLSFYWLSFGLSSLKVFLEPRRVKIYKTLIGWLAATESTVHFLL